MRYTWFQRQTRPGAAGRRGFFLPDGTLSYFAAFAVLGVSGVFGMARCDDSVEGWVGWKYLVVDRDGGWNPVPCSLPWPPSHTTTSSTPGTTLNAHHPVQGRLQGQESRRNPPSLEESDVGIQRSDEDVSISPPPKRQKVAAAFLPPIVIYLASRYSTHVVTRCVDQGGTTGVRKPRLLLSTLDRLRRPGHSACSGFLQRDALPAPPLLL